MSALTMDQALMENVNALLTARDAARYVRLSVPAFWKNVASGWLPPPVYVAPKAPRWTRAELDAAIAAKRSMPKDAQAARRKAKLARLRAATKGQSAA
jgi:predicted DNA-binding transcriptional regulator AlpA